MKSGLEGLEGTQAGIGPSLVMKGSPVRVRASAFSDLQGFFALERSRSEGFRGPPEVYVSEVLKEK
jgi:hypothetical protein